MIDCTICSGDFSLADEGGLQYNQRLLVSLLILIMVPTPLVRGSRFMKLLVLT